MNTKDCGSTVIDSHDGKNAIGVVRDVAYLFIHIDRVVLGLMVLRRWNWSLLRRYFVSIADQVRRVSPRAFQLTSSVNI